MPKVNGKKFPYDKAGMASAQAEAEKTGKPLETMPDYHERRTKMKGGKRTVIWGDDKARRK